MDQRRTRAPVKGPNAGQAADGDQGNGEHSGTASVHIQGQVVVSL